MKKIGEERRCEERGEERVVEVERRKRGKIVVRWDWHHPKTLTQSTFQPFNPTNYYITVHKTSLKKTKDGAMSELSEKEIQELIAFSKKLPPLKVKLGKTTKILVVPDEMIGIGINIESDKNPTL